MLLLLLLLPKGVLCAIYFRRACLRHCEHWLTVLQHLIYFQEYWQYVIVQYCPYRE